MRRYWVRLHLLIEAPDAAAARVQAGYLAEAVGDASENLERPGTLVMCLLDNEEEVREASPEECDEIHT